MLTPIQVVCNSHPKIFGGLHLFQSLLVNRVIKVYLHAREEPSHPPRVTFCNIKLHLPFGLSLWEAVQVILQNLTINGRFNVPYIDTKHSYGQRENEYQDDLILS